MRLTFLTAFAGFVLLEASASAAPLPQPEPTATGLWQQAGDDGRVGGWFWIAERNGVYEGRLVKAFPPPPGQPFLKICGKCTGDQKNAPMLGLAIIKGMKRHGRTYDDGSILDPRDGAVYHAQMEVSEDGQKLSVRGYLGIPLLGQTQVWKRLPDNSIAPADMPPGIAMPGAAAPAAAPAAIGAGSPTAKR